ncbi:amidohydrolase family protein [Flaviaesturariibacter terrae]
MKRLLILFSTLFFLARASAQENIYPVPRQTGRVVIRDVTVHVGNGQVLEHTSVAFENGKITAIGNSIPAAGTVIDGSGKHLYPGLILSNSNLGLVEVPSVRASSDAQEIGESNPSVHAIVAYNTDSKVINTLRPNGILLAHVVPQGGWISGNSSVVQLDAWNWEDAAYKTDNGIFITIPAMIARPRGFRAAAAAPGAAPEADPVKQGLEQVEGMKQYFRAAKAYSGGHDAKNLGYEAVQGLFDKSKKLFVRANTVRQMLVALDFVREFGFDMVIVGGADSWQIADLLAQNKVAVILNQMHSLPTLEDDDVDQPYKTPALLQKAGVLFAINDEDGQTRGRNLPFNAGTAAAYGLSKEEALSAITLNAARILGVGDRTGSIEVGKDANLVLCSGDILDMRSNLVTDAFIQGRKIPLENKQTQLYQRYKAKYGL